MELKAYSAPKPKLNKHNTIEKESGKPGSFYIYILCLYDLHNYIKTLYVVVRYHLQVVYTESCAMLYARAAKMILTDLGNQNKELKKVHFLTINQTAREIGLPHTCLRTMLAEGQLPGFYAGTRYYVNVDVLREKLDTECRTNASMRAGS